MSGAVAAIVRRGTYVDSVTLLQLTGEVMALAGVLDAALVMGTELNRELLRESGLLPQEPVGQNDLIIAVRTIDGAAAAAALVEAEALLQTRKRATIAATPSGAQSARSLRSAHRVDPNAQLAVISVPGAYAAAEAHLALADGLNVFLFSDNVSLEDEVDLKRRARQRGLLVMGPDCGTAILNGVGFGFANLVRRGSVGVVGASGTGIQEVASLLHQSGAGISHAIGTGSRDLYPAVGGITTLQAIELLRNDAATETIVLISKPADPDVARGVLQSLAATGKRAVAHLQGAAVTASGVAHARNLEEAARLAVPSWPVGTAADPATPRLRTGQRQIRGLFCGGTLCQEAASVIGESSEGHEFIDFGDDQYTRGRAHPMLDPTLRNQAIVRAASNPHVAVILLDVILGLASHPDPAGAAAPAIREAMSVAAADGREVAVLAHVVGTDRDPQELARQEEILRAEGVQLFPSNVQAANAAALLLAGVTVS